VVIETGLLQLSLELHFVIIQNRIIMRKCFENWLGLSGRIDPENITDADIAMLKALFN
jgi:hypothetical protein